ncbi:MAG: hypothetical protein J6Y43_06955 [Clostridia bacterium]|nr:hypothetical protein [Clostridia bacterium]
MKIKKFPFCYSALAITLLIATAVLFAAATVVNIYDAVKLRDIETVGFIFAVAVAALSLIPFILAVWALFYGRYVIKGGFLFCRFGLISVKTDISTIFQLTEFKTQNKLVMYFKDEKYSVAVINEKYYRDFYTALKEVNPRITYTVMSAEER